MTNRDLSSYPLNEAMEFDHVVEVHPDGRVTDGPDDSNRRELWAPELHDEQLSSDGNWTLLSGYTGQQGGGSIMHNSEYIGGRMERDILARPGYYVAIVATWTDDEDERDENEGPTVEGWAVAYQPKEGN